MLLLLGVILKLVILMLGIFELFFVGSSRRWHRGLHSSVEETIWSFV